MAEEEPRIFVDEGWKAQVERERREAAAKAAQQQPEPDATPPQQASEEGVPGYLEPSFTGIVTNLATQAMMALGGMPGPNEDEVFIDLQQAQFCVEALAVLREKTQGNLTEGEAKHLDEVLRQLAQAYTLMVREFQAQAMQEGGIDPGSPRA